MPLDNARFSSLIRRCAFNMEAFRGHFQDLSPAARAMSFVGAPSFGRVNGLPCLKQNAVAESVTSGNVSPVVDATGTFTVEAVVCGFTDGTDRLLDNTGAGLAGGVLFQRQSGAVSRVAVELFTIAGVGARSVGTPFLSVPMQRTTHCLITSVAGGTSGLGWINGIPVVITLAGAGLAANYAGARPIIAGGGNAGTQATLLVRCWTGAITNSDAQCLAEAARLLVGGW